MLLYCDECKQYCDVVDIDKQEVLLSCGHRLPYDARIVYEIPLWITGRGTTGWG